MPQNSHFRQASKKGDLLYAVLLCALALVFGLVQHWSMVQASFIGELPAYLDKRRVQRRAVQFQEVKTVTLEQAYQFWEAGEILIIDARPVEDYRDLHVERAINFPPDKWDELAASQLAGMEKDHRILVYCSQESCDDSLKLARKLQTLGFTRVLAFTGGFRAWDEAGHPVDTSR
ncbi:MAG: rhodanese-like domain-containing protein [Desulfobaccales bacterium]